jgi:hypothetical protein
MKKYFFLLFFCGALHSINSAWANSLNGFLFYKTKNENPLKKIVKEIAKANVYDATPFMNIAKTVSGQEALYKELLNTATPDELTELATKNKNAVVRLYAFRALMEKVKTAPAILFMQFKNDTTPVKVVNGKSTEMKPMNTISNGFLY